MSLTADFTPQISLRSILSGWFAADAPRASDGDAERARGRRSFLSDAMDSSPDALMGEYGLQAMMSLYPRDF